MAANSVQALCHHLRIDERVSEIIWSIIKVCLSQEIDLLIGRHLDQLIMCSIYGICKVQPGCIKLDENLNNRSQNTKVGVMFNDVIDAYKECNKQRNLALGRKQFGVGLQSNVSWVFVEVPLKLRPDGSAPAADIIQFYN